MDPHAVQNAFNMDSAFLYILLTLISYIHHCLASLLQMKGVAQQVCQWWAIPIISVGTLMEIQRVNLFLLLGNFIQISPSMEVLLVIWYLIVLQRKKNNCELKLVACFVLRTLLLKAFGKFCGVFPFLKGSALSVIKDE